MNDISDQQQINAASLMETGPRHHRSGVWLGFVALAVLIIGAVSFSYYYYYQTSVTGDQLPAAVLMDTNSAYADAYSLNSQGKFAEARAKYQEALQQVHTPELEAQIKMKIAHTVRDEGNLLQAAQLYKEIAVNMAYPQISRAYAVQSLALLYSYTGDKAVRDETFKDEPFASLYDPNNVRQSYRKLYDYAASLYPLAIPELRSAWWYAGQLLQAHNGTITLSPDTIALYQSYINDRLQHANADIERTANDPNETILRPEITLDKANVLGWIALAGYGSTDDAEKAYTDAMQTALQWGRDGYIRFWYATYLASLSNRTGDVVELLAPFYTSATYNSSAVMSFFKNERNNVLGQKAHVRLLAETDPKFKELLQSLGWTDKDFTRPAPGQ